MDARARRTRAAALESARRLLVSEGLDALTHQRVAKAAGVGRRTLYRHWADREELLHDVLAGVEYPVATRTGDLRVDLTAHLEALRAGLAGALRYVVLALNERAAVQPELQRLRDELTEGGREPLHELLRDAVSAGRLPADLDREWAIAALEGPLFYRSLVVGEDIPPSTVSAVVGAFLAAVASGAGRIPPARV